MLLSFFGRARFFLPHHTISNPFMIYMNKKQTNQKSPRLLDQLFLTLARRTSRSNYCSMFVLAFMAVTGRTILLLVNNLGCRYYARNSMFEEYILHPDGSHGGIFLVQVSLYHKGSAQYSMSNKSSSPTIYDEHRSSLIAKPPPYRGKQFLEESFSSKSS